MSAEYEAASDMVERLACTMCSAISEGDDVNECSQCGSTSVSDDWAGVVVIAHPEQSEIASELGVTEAGKYALKVR